MVYKRYYHVFRQGELEGLIDQHGGIERVKSYYDKDNWCCLVRRVQ